ncbi:MAG: alpha/beta hydrolase [Methyloligellaceae bacterium]
MSQDQTRFIEFKSEKTVPRRIAYLSSDGQDDKPGVFWLSGFKSNMRSLKVTALAEWCVEKNYRFCRFDYSGHGESDGAFEDGTISQWLEEALYVFEQKTSGKQVLVGSSMGGWIGLLLLRALADKLADRIAGAVFIAPAWDMTETLMWERFPEEVREEMERTGRFLRPSQYDSEPQIISKGLIEDGRQYLLRDEKVRIGCPIRIIHGLRDPDVPWQHSRKLIEHLQDEDMVLTLVKDGEHRLSREQDIRRLISEIAQFY